MFKRCVLSLLFPGSWISGAWRCFDLSYRGSFHITFHQGTAAHLQRSCEFFVSRTIAADQTVPAVLLHSQLSAIRCFQASILRHSYLLSLLFILAPHLGDFLRHPRQLLSSASVTFITVRSFLLLTLTGSNRSFCATFSGLRVGLLLSVFDASPQLSGIELPEDFSLALAVL